MTSSEDANETLGQYIVVRNIWMDALVTFGLLKQSVDYLSKSVETDLVVDQRIAERHRE